MPTYSVVCCMRNEAIFVLEWIAYQLVVGFDTVAIVTNDCTDNTDRMISRMAAYDDRIVHIPNKIEAGEAPQVAGMRQALAHPRIAASDYVLHCDADEFLHVSVGAGRVSDLMAQLKTPDCIALAWRPFGDSGRQWWDGGSVLDQCVFSDAKLRPHTVQHKSMFRPSRFGSAIDHQPKEPLVHEVTLVNSAGQEMNSEALFAGNRARYVGNDASLLTWQNACIHHYAIKSRDVFLMKNVRGDGMALDTAKYFVNSTFWRRYNRNQVEVQDARQHLFHTERIVAEMRCLNKVRRWEREALEGFREKRSEILTDDAIQAWTHGQVISAPYDSKVGEEPPLRQVACS